MKINISKKDLHILIEQLKLLAYHTKERDEYTFYMNGLQEFSVDSGDEGYNVIDWHDKDERSKWMSKAESGE